MIYRQLTLEERYQIYTALKCEKSHAETAILLKRHRSTIWRERWRNAGANRSYRALHAQLVANRRKLNRVYLRKLTPELQRVIRKKLVLQWSPQQICGRMRLEGYDCVCPETIYRWIARNQRRGGFLWMHLRTANKIRKKRIRIPSDRTRIQGRIGIRERPAIVEKRIRIGDFERDTIIGKNHQSSILTIVDRVSKKTYIKKLKNHESLETHQKTVELLKQETVHTLTNDNGFEFRMHQKTAEELNTHIFFTTPYRSGERGTNENTNGLIRQYFPKSTDFREIPEQRILEVQNLLNFRPRKSLGYRTPHEVHAGLQQNYCLVALDM
jgi:IS30 family transposase